MRASGYFHVLDYGYYCLPQQVIFKSTCVFTKKGRRHKTQVRYAHACDCCGWAIKEMRTFSNSEIIRQKSFPKYSACFTRQRDEAVSGALRVITAHLTLFSRLCPPRQRLIKGWSLQSEAEVVQTHEADWDQKTWAAGSRVSARSRSSPAHRYLNQWHQAQWFSPVIQSNSQSWWIHWTKLRTGGMKPSSSFGCPH